MDGKLKSPWIFRGHNDASWKLLPKFWRIDDKPMPDMIRAFAGSNVTPSAASSDIWWGMYVDMLEQFSHRADKIGIHRKVNMRECYAYDANKELYIELESLAQHHGLPTRFLDWSYEVLSAAFFAASSTQDQNANSYCCVWALNTRYLENIDFGASPDPSDLTYRHRIQLIKPSNSSSDNIRAQSGIFTLVGELGGFPVSYFERHRHWPSIEAIIEKSEYDVKTLYQQFGEMRPLLRKILLPNTEARKVRRILSLRGVSYSRLFPSFEGVAKEMLGSL